MIKTNIEKLRQPRWFKPFEDDDIEAKLIPSAGVEVGNAFFRGDEGFCRDAFTEFRGYWNDTEKLSPVENTLEHRLELMKWDAFRNALRFKMSEWNEAIARGEDLDG